MIFFYTVLDLIYLENYSCLESVLDFLGTGLFGDSLLAVFTNNFLTIGLNKLLAHVMYHLICLQPLREVSGYTKPAVKILNVLL